ncbi:cob(I)yrinic acid a,c-diamide adenosyltransferase [Sphingomonas sp. HT-1]|uniref:cob(I)yrinic acid a,c-diamide adenosyltransferase n=1 Tax=unclassified Sphingomonas TaxID=196159 RepID=UPI0002D9385E|nr:MULTISPECIES: cob(I)yrinic acid a,c-diamide adenosyltransferase [unclassified Sphingomonas]KTF70786.1 cob(I)yrinic acid a c-diamide adenosyltransferase [Sphingomonas sp. WG]
MVKLNKIYTRTGDAGTTGLADGSRVSKASARLEAIGDVDEANSAIGVARTLLAGDPLDPVLARIQNDLFDLGADLATPGDREGALRITADQIRWLEESIDAANEALAPLNSFVLPGGSPAAAAIHLARAITRRAERAAVAANDQGTLSNNALVYLNRLSDFLFVAARVMNQNGRDDVLWVPGGPRNQ